MNIHFIRVCLAAIACSVAVPVSAGVSQDFSNCDGLKKPKRSNDGMRGEASFPAYTFGQKSNLPRATIAACNRALESGKLRPNQTLRLAHIMRARAAAKLELDDVAGALEDIEAAKTAAASYADDFFYARSMGVSIELMHAIALNESGKRESALAIAEAAAAKRPYGLDIQRIAAMLRTANGDDPASRANWQHVSRIDPKLREITLQLLSQPRDFAALAASAGAPSVVVPKQPSFKLLMKKNGGLNPMFAELAGPVNRAMTTPYALAASGRADDARAWVRATGDALEDAVPSKQPDEENSKNGANGLNGLFIPIVRRQKFDPMKILVEARIAIEDGRLTDAATLLKGRQWRSSAVTKELHAAYESVRQAVPMEAPALPKLTSAAERKPSRLAGMAKSLLIQPESRRKLIDYKKSRPNILGAMAGAVFSLGTNLLGGIDRTTGFRSTEEENGTVKVEYTGNTTSGPVVQEMTLLRAAELAHEAGKTHFQIVSRNDYQRFTTTMVNHVPTSRVLTGYKTELTIKFLGVEENDGDSLEAVAVIDALGPVYYEG